MSSISTPTTNFDWQACVDRKECGTFVDSRDKRTYKWVTVGSQIWMSENLKYSKNASIGHCPTNEPSDKSDNAYCLQIGRLYTWAEAMGFPTKCNDSNCKGAINDQHQGICPDGWHLPTLNQTQWSDFISAVKNGGSDFQVNLKATGWDNGTDLFGFNAVPVVGDSVFYWYQDEWDINDSYGMRLRESYTDASAYAITKGISNSVRCQKNTSSNSSSSASSTSTTACGTLAAGKFCDARDGKSYTFKKYGVQYWMTQNLNWEGSGKCLYATAAECDKRGRHYSPEGTSLYDTPRQFQQGACPDGWRTPSLDDWKDLAYSVVGVQNLKGVDAASNTEWNSSFNNQDSAGFHLLPAGYVDYLSLKNELTDSLTSAYMLSTDVKNSSEFYFFIIDTDGGNRGTETWFGAETPDWKDAGGSLRCVKVDWSVAP